MATLTVIKKLLIATGGAAFAVVGTLGMEQAKAATLFADNFDSENQGQGEANYNKFLNFIVSKGTVDLIGNGFFGHYPGNGLYIDLDGSTFQGGTLTTRNSFSLSPGSYNLSFDLGNNATFQQTNIVDVSLGTVYNESFTVKGPNPFTTINRTIVVTSPTTARLSFSDRGNDNQGGVIDNIVLSTTAVPEPSSTFGLLALIGLSTTTFLKRNKK